MHIAQEIRYPLASTAGKGGTKILVIFQAGIDNGLGDGLATSTTHWSGLPVNQGREVFSFTKIIAAVEALASKVNGFGRIWRF